MARIHCTSLLVGLGTLLALACSHSAPGPVTNPEPQSTAPASSEQPPSTATASTPSTTASTPSTSAPSTPATSAAPVASGPTVSAAPVSSTSTAKAPATTSSGKSAEPGPVASYSRDTLKIEVRIAQTFKYLVPSNPTTPMRWSAKSVPEGALLIVRRQYQEQSTAGCKDCVGSGGMDEFTVEGVKLGHATLRLELQPLRPKPGAPPAQLVEVPVDVVAPR